MTTTASSLDRGETRLIKWGNPRFHYVMIGLMIFLISLLYYAFLYLYILNQDKSLAWFYPYAVFEMVKHYHGLLYYIPMLYSVLFTKRNGIVITWIVSFMLNLPQIIYYFFGVMFTINNLLILLVPLALLMIFIIERNWRERENSIMQERVKERQNYIGKVLKVQEEERKKLSYEIHDGAIQDLIGVANRSSQLLSECENDPRIKEMSTWFKTTVLEICDDLRKISLDLRPSILDTMGLLPAVKYLLEKLSRDQDIKTKIVVSGETYPLNAETEAHLFRVVQEALNNIKRHSQAKTAVILFEFLPEKLKIKISDDGKGYSLSRTKSSVNDLSKAGILGMRYRVELAGGTLNIKSELGAGTSVYIEIKRGNENRINSRFP